MFDSTGRRFLAVAAVLVLTAGCGAGALGSLGEVLEGVLAQPGAAGQGQATVEIRGVDTRQQLIQVATQEGQTGAVRYDQNTLVVYRDQQYPVTALERGDVVVMQIQEVQGGLYTQRIDVQQSVQDRTGTGAADVVQLAGRISAIDHNAGTFVVQTQQGNVTISLPYNPPQATVDYFHRLRRGDNVRLEARPIAAGRAEIHRFL